MHLITDWLLLQLINRPGRPILDSDLIGSDRILLFFVGIQVTDSHRIYTVGEIHRILMTDFVSFHRPQPIGSCYYIQRNPPLGSCYYIRRNRPVGYKTSVFSPIWRFCFGFSQLQKSKLHFLYLYEDFLLDFYRFKIQHYTCSITIYRFILDFSGFKI